MDAAVLARARAGDEAAFVVIYEHYSPAIHRFAYRLLGNQEQADDITQDTFIRAWRGFDRFEGRAALRSWLYRIATNVSLDMLSGKERRARPMDLGPAREPVESNLHTLPEVTWIEPVPDGLVLSEDADPAELAQSRETLRLAFVAALQHLPPRQRAVLILCEVLRWKAASHPSTAPCSGPARRSSPARSAWRILRPRSMRPMPSSSPATSRRSSSTTWMRSLR